MARRKNKTELTIREQCDLLHGDGAWHIPGVPRLKIKPFEMHDGPCGLRYVSEESGLIPDSDRNAICYPAPCLTACSFDIELMREIGQSIAQECLANDTNMILAPGINIKRNPLCGRNFEYLSEDPYLSGKMGAAFVKGVQGKNVGACIKHYCCNSQESYRLINDSVVDQRALHELYLKPFEIAIKEANPWAVMAAYNKINGTYASDNDYLLKDVLRKKWKYDGVVMSDWGATNDYIDSHNHGLDVEMPCLYKRRSFDLINAYRLRALSSTELNLSSQRVLRMHQKAALAKKETFDPDKAHELAVRAATKSMVLLKNDGILPILNLDKTCVIGDLARIMRYQGGGSSHVKPYKLPSFVEVINEGRANPIPFASGYFLDDKQDDHNAMMDAADLASRCESAIVFIGLPPDSETEGLDRENMLLPEDQLTMLDAISEVNENIIVVLCCGAPTELPFLKKCRALLLAYLGGEGLSEAVFKIITGAVSPSGKLAETWPIHLTDVPSFGFYPGFAEYSLYKESIYVGYRYYLSCDKKVNFPFGHGLSYAKFSQKLTLGSNKLNGSDLVQVRVDVKNESNVASEKVIQLYAGSNHGNVFKPTRTLIAFTKVYLYPGETKSVSFQIGMASLSHFDALTKTFQTESGIYSIELGNSSTDIVASATLEVIGVDAESLKSSMPAYYSPSKDGFLLADETFEAALGEQKIPMATDRKERPFNLNSTLGDISDTWIGKLLHRQFEKTVGMPPTDPKARWLYESYNSNPIRFVSMGGKKLAHPKVAAALLDFANGRYFRGALKFIFGVGVHKKAR